MRDINVGLRRIDFMRLCALSRTAFDSRARRGQFHVVLMYDDKDDESRSYYSSTGALLTILANELAERYGMDLDTASALAYSTLDLIVPRWAKISQSSLDLVEERATEELLCGVYETTRAGEPIPVCDTIDKIASQLAEWKPLTGVVLVSITRVAATMRRRAADYKIDLSEFWRPDRYAPGGAA